MAAGWSFEDGWLPSYPETTGYIIETFLAAARVLNRLDLVARAHRMIDWELSLQAADGAFPGHFGEPGSHPVIFNQGQIMHGLVAGHCQLGRQDCLEAMVRADHWFVRQQDADGCFRRFEHNATPHVYNTRATWALLSAGLGSGESALVDAAIRNLDWALTQQTASGWYATNAFVPERACPSRTGSPTRSGVFSSAAYCSVRPAISSLHCWPAGASRGRDVRMVGWRAPTRTAGCRTRAMPA